MDLGETRREATGERILPMINVAFLLLILVVMMTELAPSAPFEVAAPLAETSDRAGGDLTLFVGADGTMSFDGRVGEANVLAAIADEFAAACPESPCVDAPVLTLHADQALPGAAFAALLSRLGSAGVTEVELVTALP